MVALPLPLFLTFLWWVIECLGRMMLRHEVARRLQILKGGELSDEASVISTTKQGGGQCFDTLVLYKTP